MCVSSKNSAELRINAADPPRGPDVQYRMRAAAQLAFYTSSKRSTRLQHHEIIGYAQTLAGASHPRNPSLQPCADAMNPHPIRQHRCSKWGIRISYVSISVPQAPFPCPLSHLAGADHRVHFEGITRCCPPLPLPEAVNPRSSPSSLYLHSQVHTTIPAFLSDTPVGATKARESCPLARDLVASSFNPRVNAQVLMRTSKKVLLCLLLGALLLGPAIRAEEEEDEEVELSQDEEAYGEDDDGAEEPAEADDADVLVLTDKTFDDQIGKTKFALVRASVRHRSLERV